MGRHFIVSVDHGREVTSALLIQSRWDYLKDTWNAPARGTRHEIFSLVELLASRLSK